jgi:hypothetical protein
MFLLCVDEVSRNLEDNKMKNWKTAKNCFIPSILVFMMGELKRTRMGGLTPFLKYIEIF